MVNYSDIFPLTTTVTSTIFEGLTWEDKSANFTATAGKGYICSPSARLIVTLPSNPQVNDTIGFMLKTGTKILFTTSDKISGNLLATNYAKEVTPKYLMVKLTYSGSTNGWTWDSSYNSFIKDGYLTGTTLNYTSTSSLNGVINYIGTNRNTSGFSNPLDSGLITVFLTTGTQITPSAYFDQSPTSAPGNAPLSGLQSNMDNGIKILFKQGTYLTPTKVAVRVSTTGAYTISLEGIRWDDTTSWLADVSVSAWVTTWLVFNCSTTEEFKGLYFHTYNFRQITLFEIEAWGIYYGY